MKDTLYIDFLSSSETLRVYKDDRLLFHSDKDGLQPLVEYIETCTPYEPAVTVFDRVTGNAAALLLSIISCREVHSKLGSQLAADTLDRLGIEHYFDKSAPYIENASRQGMCPMEELSLNKTPDGFYRALKERLAGIKTEG